MRARRTRLGPGIVLWATALVVVAVPVRAEDPPSRVEVVVRGDKVRPPLPPKDRSVAGSVIPPERLRGAGLQAADALRSQPGLTVVETGGQGALSTASIRGATAAQTPVYLGGVRINDDVAGTADLSLVPLWLIDRVEIYRGNAPLEADQLGIGGAIFFEPKRARKPGAGVGASVGSYGSRSAWTWASAGDQDSSALVGARVEGAANDYSIVDDRGTRFNSSDDVERTRTNADVRTADFWTLGSTRVGERGSVELMVNGIGREQGVPGLTLLPTRSARASMQRSLFSARFRTPCAAGDACMITATSAALLARSSLEDPDLELALGSVRVDTQGRRSEQSLGARIDLSDRVTIHPLFRTAIEQLRIEAPGAAEQASQRVFSRAALGTEWRATHLVAARAMVSAECNGTSDHETRFCDSAQPSARAGLQVGQGRLVVLANAGRYVRVPTLGELYGVSGVVRGNAELVAEQGWTTDAGVRVTSGRWGPIRGAFVDLFGFVRKADDLVAWRRSSMGYVRPYNVGSARVMGLEGLAAIGWSDFLRLELAATLLDPRDTTPGRTAINDFLPYRSRLVLAPMVEAHTDAFAAAGVDKALLMVRYVYQSSRYADEAGLVVIPEQATLDVEAEIRVLHEQLSIRARLANALNQRRFDVIGYALAGRAVYTAVEARW